MIVRSGLTSSLLSVPARLLAPVLLCLVSGFAHATSIDLGAFSAGDSASLGGDSIVVGVGGGTDSYDFTLSDQSNVAVDIVTESSGWVLLSGAGVQILGQGGGGSSFTVTDLAPDDYTLEVRYGALGFGTVGYTGTLSVTAVPLPAAAWLFLTAITGLVVTKGKGRKRPLASFSRAAA
mgnify:CR=1 FL=1